MFSWSFLDSKKLCFYQTCQLKCFQQLFASHIHRAGLNTIFIQIYMDAPPRVSKEPEGRKVFAQIFSPNLWQIFKVCLISALKHIKLSGFLTPLALLGLHPLWRYHVFLFIFDISEWWRPLQLFSNNSK